MAEKKSAEKKKSGRKKKKTLKRGGFFKTSEAYPLTPWIEVQVQLSENKGACPSKCPNRPAWCTNGCKILAQWQAGCRVGASKKAVFSEPISTGRSKGHHRPCI